MNPALVGGLSVAPIVSDRTIATRVIRRVVSVRARRSRKKARSSNPPNVGSSIDHFESASTASPEDTVQSQSSFKAMKNEFDTGTTR